VQVAENKKQVEEWGRLLFQILVNTARCQIANKLIFFPSPVMPATRWSTSPPLHHFMDKMVYIPHTKVRMSISTFPGILQLLCLFWKTDTMIQHLIGLWLYLQNIVANAQVFCLEHRTYANHKCTKANEQDVTVLVCPICSQSVRSVPNEDPNVTWERHVQTNCNPSNYAKANKKPRYAFSNQTGVWHSDLT